MSAEFPNRIVCMTEESVEFLYALGLEDKIVGVSAYVKRPGRAREKPVISAFISANLKKILDLKPDLVLGYSDIQKEIARDLIGEGINVFIANHRSLEETLNYLSLLGRMVGAEGEANQLVEGYRSKMAQAQKRASLLKKRPKVYLEEWDDPMISGIAYFSQLVELCGGIDINRHLSAGKLARERFTSGQDVIEAAPDLIFGCWCGKKVDIDAIRGREGWSDIPAVKNGRVFELPPEIFLQPGPALFVDGIDILIKYFEDYFLSEP